MKEIVFWGIRFNPVSQTELVDAVQTQLQAGKRGLHITGVNPEQIVKAQRDPLLRQAINESDIVNIDGILAVVSLRLRGFKIPERVATPDVMQDFLGHADRNRQKVYFLGAEPVVVKNAVENVRKRFPGLVMTGYHDGFFKDESGIVEEIAALKPDYLFIALPSPMKEKFILKYKHELDVGVFYGVGGAFDVLGGKCHRAPKLFQVLWLEWLWRICQNPRQNFVRVIRFYPTFARMIFQDFFHPRPHISK